MRELSDEDQLFLSKTRVKEKHYIHMHTAYRHLIITAKVKVDKHKVLWWSLQYHQQSYSFHCSVCTHDH